MLDTEYSLATEVIAMLDMVATEVIAMLDTEYSLEKNLLGCVPNEPTTV